MFIELAFLRFVSAKNIFSFSIFTLVFICFTPLIIALIYISNSLNFVFSLIVMVHAIIVYFCIRKITCNFNIIKFLFFIYLAGGSSIGITYIANFCWAHWTSQKDSYFLEAGVIWNDDEKIFLQGDITLNSYEEFVSAYNRIPDSDKLFYLMLDSNGGRVAEAQRIADKISRNKNLVAVVGRDGKCESACTVIFSSAPLRWAHPTARFMWHGTFSAAGLPYMPRWLKNSGWWNSNLRDNLDQYTCIQKRLDEAAAFSSFDQHIFLSASEIAVIEPDFLTLTDEDGIQPSILNGVPAGVLVSRNHHENNLEWGRPVTVAPCEKEQRGQNR